MGQRFSGMTLDRYHLLEQIGTGGAGDVYFAQDTHMLIGREVAVKVIELPGNSEEAKSAVIVRFKREIKAITQLRHPHILTIFDYGIAPVFGIQLAYIVMPRCEYSLDAWLEKFHNSEPLSLQDTAHLLQQAASALQEAHSHDIFHKDVKLQNFLVQSNVVHPHLPNLLLTDFGVAKLNTAPFTIGNLPWGTPTYMPLEQWQGKPVPATDQYALAVMIYKLLTCHFPYHSDNPEEMNDPDWMREQHCDLDLQPEPPSKYKATIPTIVDDVVLKALAKKPEDRYPSITDFAQAFQDALKRLEKGANIYMTLAINEAEAVMGTEYTLKLPNGQQTIITVPAGTEDGQELRKDGEGETSPFGGPNGDLIVTLVMKPSIASDHIIKELHHISQAIGNLSPKSSSDEIIKQLQLLSQTTGNLSPKSSSDEILKQLQLLSQTTSNLSPKSSSDKIIKQLQYLSPKSSSDEIIKHLQRLDDKIEALQSKFDDDQQSIHQQVKDISGIMNAIAISTVKANAIVLASTSSQNFYPPYKGNLVFNDPLSDNTLGNNWTTSPDHVFEGGTYYIRGSGYCYPSGVDFTNFTYQVLMTIYQGNAGGITFRTDEGYEEYFFRIWKSGTYQFGRFDNSSHAITLSNGDTSAFHQELGQPNLIAVVTQGDSFDLYINFQHILHATDNTFTHGKIGVWATATSGPLNVGFNNAKVWTL